MIELIHLRKEYDDLVAVQDLNLTIPQGEIFGLIGPNGAGKTTTIRMACGLLAPTTGRALVNGIDVSEEPERAQQIIGYLSDFFALYEDLKVWEYLDYFAHAYKMNESEIPARVNEAIAQVSLEVKRDAMIRGLSRGMKQRLGIARSIIHRPKLLLLDEPASGLDPRARIDLRELLKVLATQGKAILISSHILTELAEICTGAVIIERGKILRAGTLQQILQGDKTHRTVVVRVLGRAEELRKHLLETPGVEDARLLDGAAVEADVAGDDAACCDLLAAVVGAGFRVLEYRPRRADLEQIFLDVTRGDVQ